MATNQKYEGYIYWGDDSGTIVPLRSAVFSINSYGNPIGSIKLLSVDGGKEYFTTDKNGFYSVSLDKPELLKFESLVWLSAYSKDPSNSSKIKLSDVLEEPEGQEVKIKISTDETIIPNGNSPNILNPDKSLKNLIYFFGGSALSSRPLSFESLSVLEALNVGQHYATSVAGLSGTGASHFLTKQKHLA